MFILEGLIFGLLRIVKMFVTRWLVDRWPDDVAVPAPAEMKAYELQDQVNSKVLWDAPECEVLEWLEEKHSITGESARQMLRLARFARRRTIREKALYGAVASLMGLLVSGGLIWAQLAGGFIFIFRSLVIVAAFGFCGICFARYLARLITGQTSSSAGL